MRTMVLYDAPCLVAPLGRLRKSLRIVDRRALLPLILCQWKRGSNPAPLAISAEQTASLGKIDETIQLSTS